MPPVGARPGASGSAASPLAFLAADMTATVRACIPMAIATRVTIDVAARVFERFGEIVALDMQHCQSSGEVFVTYADAAAAERLLQNAEEMIKELGSSDVQSTSDEAVARTRALLDDAGQIPEYVSLLGPTADELPVPFGSLAPSKEGQSPHFRPDLVAGAQDNRTSIVVSGLPMTCTAERLLQGMKLYGLNSKLRFFYLPVDEAGNAVGHAFMDFEEPIYILHLWHQLGEIVAGLGMALRNAYISYSRIQGRSQLLEHFRSSDLMFSPDANRRPQFFFPDCC